MYKTYNESDMYKRRELRTNVCRACGKSFRSAYTRKWCSLSCYRVHDRERQKEYCRVHPRARYKGSSGYWRAVIFNSVGWNCAKCGGNSRIEVDHIIPDSLGGKHDISNLQPLCHSCHLAKTALERKLFVSHRKQLTQEILPQEVAIIANS